MTPPPRLYKYLPQAFVSAIVDHGSLLMRSLSYFRKLEPTGRGDLLEGLHMDKPDNAITIETVDGSARWTGHGAVLNRVNDERLLVFCLSTIFGDGFFDEFSCDACVEILEPAVFLDRAAAIINGQKRFATSGLLHRRVLYYAPNAPFGENVRDVRVIPFVKHQGYSHQAEYRLAAALSGGLDLTTQIISDEFSWDAEIANAKAAKRVVRIGCLRDIVKVHLRNPMI